MCVGWEVTIQVIVHDGMCDLMPNGAGGEHLRCEICERFGKICHQERINGPKLVGTVELKFQKRYKNKRASQQTILGHLRLSA